MCRSRQALQQQSLVANLPYHLTPLGVVRLRDHISSWREPQRWVLNTPTGASVGATPARIIAPAESQDMSRAVRRLTAAVPAAERRQGLRGTARFRPDGCRLPDNGSRLFRAIGGRGGNEQRCLAMKRATMGCTICAKRLHPQAQRSARCRNKDRVRLTAAGAIAMGPLLVTPSRGSTTRRWLTPQGMGEMDDPRSATTNKPGIATMRGT